MALWFFVISQRPLVHLSLQQLERQECRDFLGWCFFPDDEAERAGMSRYVASFVEALRTLPSPPIRDQLPPSLVPFVGPEAHFRFLFLPALGSSLRDATLATRLVSLEVLPDLTSLSLLIEAIDYSEQQQQQQGAAKPPTGLLRELVKMVLMTS